ncbi:protein of unknown function [Cyclobacterium lianum]|uniref:Por secretion system C-terminal sorting domain-containing protein n=1 Tax=Cyclobacterium lianum TaxID=388280 RepID=A0A1M7PTX2_9BACT|nr:DUF3244 domain-containing protein [Cyclobacterium lianum]SHN20907.1 protein of unknown function [Cyclobacterium lianum]
MKILATLLMTMSLAFGSLAAEKSLMEITSIQVGEQKFTIHLAEAVGRVHVSIINAAGKVIERNLFIVKEPLNIPFNISKLPEGAYKVKLKTKEETVNFELENKKKVEKKLMAYAKPLDERTFSLTVLGVEKPGTEITIFDESGKRIATDEVRNTGGFSKNYHLKFMKLDEVYVRVRNADGKIKYLYFD